MSSTFDTDGRDFRSDYEQSFGTSGYDYQRFRPAYQYGYDPATEKRFRVRDWNAIETNAGRDWERLHPGDAWQDFKGAVRHAYERVREDVRDALD
jgi:hypothetical protein